MNVEVNLQQTRDKMQLAIQRSGRNTGEVKLVAVSKTVSDDKVWEAYRAGQTIFGENRVQEWQKKYPLFPKECEWHIIGRLQTNKVKYLNSRVSLIHSLDRFELLEKLNSEGQKKGLVWPVLVQVNIARDEAKAGLEINEVKDFIEEAVSCTNVKIRGLMTIGALEANEKETRLIFRHLKELKNQLLESKIPNRDEFSELSMGMSKDFEVAIEEGATIIRVGSNIFGTRN
ncbi:MAG: YggS family pyridoxal phosphate-dependent enzyme [Eubacteriales bacterium]